MELTTARLILRPWKISDAEDLYMYARDERIGPVAGWPPHLSADESAEIIKTVFAQPEVYAVVLKETDQAIGCIGIMIGDNSNYTHSEREGEVAYWIGVPYWGRGMIPEALKRIIQHAFLTLGLTDLWCVFFAENQNSKRAQAKCGFKQEYVLQNQFNEFLQEYREEEVWRLTKTDWLKEQ